MTHNIHQVFSSFEADQVLITELGFAVYRVGTHFCEAWQRGTGALDLIMASGVNGKILKTLYFSLY